MVTWNISRRAGRIPVSDHHRAGQPALPILGAAVLAGLMAIASGSTTQAAPIPSRVPSPVSMIEPVTPSSSDTRSDFIATVGSDVDGSVFTAARLWDTGVNWCDLAPTADADIAGNIERLLAPKIDRLVAAGAHKIILPLGHPAPWIFGDHPRAQSLATRWSSGKRPLWFCSGTTSSVSIPNPASLQPLPDGTPSLQQRRFAQYAGAVVKFIVQRYQNRLAVDLQVWNEPNLLNGIDTAARIPGAAQTTGQVVASLRALERIVAAQITAYPGGNLRLISPSFYQRMNDTMRTYLNAQNREPLISALAFNFYSFSATPQAMINNWDYRVGSLAKSLRKYRNLRTLPRLITETNHNLNNHRPYERINTSGAVTAAAAQKRLAAATQLNALYWGFSSVYWLLPLRGQAAVALSFAPENAARQALAQLAWALGDRELTGCSTRSGNRFCYFADPAGIAPQARVVWRMSGTRWLAVNPDTSIADLATGTLRVTTGESIRISTTPIVIWQNPARIA